jgi:hypothetical protein
LMGSCLLYLCGCRSWPMHTTCDGGACRCCCSVRACHTLLNRCSCCCSVGACHTSQPLQLLLQCESLSHFSTAAVAAAVWEPVTLLNCCSCCCSVRACHTSQPMQLLLQCESLSHFSTAADAAAAASRMRLTPVVVLLALVRWLLVVCRCGRVFSVFAAWWCRCTTMSTPGSSLRGCAGRVAGRGRLAACWCSCCATTPASHTQVGQQEGGVQTSAPLFPPP